ncbi:hypothetical protein HK100_000489 [Physocladia obscura]|uniref:Uncharacterized protein n=1 Tax=Physocladia obscura TaxID=109957 RepID=A0AAD5TAM6_9FUNG|nr:hypothetical protein HK100_000489 [Physocladia obscura]
MFLLDDTGLIVSSTVNNTVRIALNSTFRYNSYSNNANPIINSLGKALISIYGLNTTTNRYNLPNFTINFATLQGELYIVSTMLVIMPESNQQYTLVLYAPRSDFYAIGLLLVAIIAYVGSLPLRRMSLSMKYLTKFDFSVLESGKLDSTSRITELYNVESSFLGMVKAFAGAIRMNKGLISSEVKTAKKL